MQFARANKGKLAGHYSVLNTNDTENDLELKKEMQETKLHRISKVHNIVEM